MASFGDVIGNWRGPWPWPVKLRLAIRNNAIKVLRRRSCCGNHGQPGC